MHVTLFGFVLFLHITVAIVAFMMGGVLHAALQALARADDVREMRSWGRLVHVLDPLFPFAALLLLGFGAWLIHLSEGEVRWGDGWLLTALITLIVVEGLSGVLIAPKAKAAVKLIEQAPDGPVPDDLRRLALDPAIWHISHTATFGFTGVVFLMAAKPSGALSVVIVIASVAIGVLVSLAQLRPLRGSAGAGVAIQRQVDAV
ncbi:MAG TPA: DUF2269 family protein [Acidothermaceae bacterium]|nr:DUF2269 family protein [Acidothermaceae bacterium]